MPDTAAGFPGLMAGYPEVAVDRFTGPCLQARFFLLSHLHWDHMQGLDSAELLAALSALPGGRLLLSRQSAALLAGWPRFAPLLPHLCPLEVGCPRQLTARLVVTPLPAAHCPGSVMFLLEGGDAGTVLYTGDFRLSRRHLADMKPLHDADGRPKPVDVLYADTTFCVPQRRELPERSRSAECVRRLVTEWLQRGPGHIANLECRARYGYEHMFRSLYEATGMRVHVGEEKYRLYERLPDIAQCLTPDASETRLHSCRPGGTCLRDSAASPLRSVILSTMFFFLNQEVNRLEYPLGKERYRVLYSFHASLSQVREMVTYLRPGRVVPCVVPPGGSLEGVVALLGGAAGREAGEEEEPDGRWTPLLTGGDWERRDKRPLTGTDAESGRPRGGLAGEGEASAGLKWARVEPQSPRRSRGIQEPPPEFRGQQESPRRQGRQESPLKAVKSPRCPDHQNPADRPPSQPAAQAAVVDTRPAWKCPFS